jgi:lysosomal Pro-X carboxypeptidase
MMWDFQLCTTYIAPVGFSESSMFPQRKWTLENLTKYCQRRYGKEVTPQPYKLVVDFGIDDLVREGASRILFTNGMKDLWFGGSHVKSLSDSIIALNFKNGAHHSDLTHRGPSEEDTDDIKHGFATITNILQSWLGQIQVER